MKATALVSATTFADAALAAGVSPTNNYLAKILKADGSQAAAKSGTSPTFPAFDATVLPNGTYTAWMARIGSDGYPIGTPATKTFVLDEQTVSVPSVIDVTLS